MAMCLRVERAADRMTKYKLDAIEFWRIYTLLAQKASLHSAAHTAKRGWLRDKTRRYTSVTSLFRNQVDVERPKIFRIPIYVYV